MEATQTLRLKFLTTKDDTMKIRQSFIEIKPTLYLVSTPIGNLEDMTFRAIETLKKVDVIYAEDTRNSGRLLKHFDIETKLESVHEHNQAQKVDTMLDLLRQNKNIALISDAGMPRISDPGDLLVKACLDHDYTVVPIPGANALTTALIASPFQTHPFLFYGFLPAKKTQREKALESLKTRTETLIFYEAPHRINAMLESLKTVFDDRHVCIARELTKRYETFIDMYLSEIKDLEPLKGEMVVIVEGFKQGETFTEDDMIEHIELLIHDGKKEMDAIKQVAKLRSMKKNDVYMAYQTHKKHFKK